MEIIKNFAAGALVVGGVVALFLFTVVSIFQFSWWISGGQLWGLLLAGTLCCAVMGGAGFAVSEHKP